MSVLSELSDLKRVKGGGKRKLTAGEKKE
ncbi:hypothetical protein IWX65_002960, partial [Arthrobacter sp. CAN_A214]